jgi:flagellar biosynthesis/type III secretory pathway protein FliH
MNQDINFGNLLATLIVGLPAILAAVGALITSLRNGRRIEENTAITVATKTDVAKKLEMGEATRQATVRAADLVIASNKQSAVVIQEVAKTINGRMDQHLEEAKNRAYAEGLREGQKLTHELKEQIATNSALIRSHEEQIKRHAEHYDENAKLLREEIAKLTALIKPPIGESKSSA